jgi:LPS-assembly protein
MVKNIHKIILFLLIFFLHHENSYAEKSIYELQGKTIAYTDNNNLIIASGNAYAIDQFGKEIFSDKIIYEKSKSIIRTEKNSVYLDGKGNRLLAANFFYDLNLKKIKASDNVNYYTKEENHFKFSTFDYYENSEKGFGLNFKGLLADGTVLEGPKAEIDNQKGTTTINKNKNKFYNYLSSLFTSYKKRNSYTPCINEKFTIENTVEERCPDWSITSTQTTHDKNKKMLYHEGVLIHLKNIPIFYTPYFSHPDPSVKRKSGLLPPILKNFEHLGRTLKAPYFWAIDDNKDLTFTPIIYFQENSVYLAEYRQQNQNSSLYIDTSYTKGYKRLDKLDAGGSIIPRKKGSRHHFFSRFAGNYKNLLLENNDLEINVQKISTKNYLKVHQINTLYLREDVTSLESNVILNSYTGGKNIEISSRIYENINDNSPNTKYSYVLPSVVFNNYFNKYKQFVNTSNTFSASNSGGDTNRIYQNNSIDTASDLKTIKTLPGVGNIFKTSIRNINIYNENVSGAKENMNSDSYFTLALENTYPLMRINEKTEQTIAPKIFSKYTSSKMKDSSSQNKILSYSDVYSMERMNTLTNPETGVSFGYGTEYNIIKKNLENSIYLDGRLSIGQVLRTNKLKEMPQKSSLQEKKSDFVGNGYLNLNNIYATNRELSNDKFKYYNLNLDYSYIINNNLNKLLQNNLKATFENKKNTFTSEYSESHDIEDYHSINAEYKRKFDNNLNLIVGATHNIQESFLERSNVELNYESDCLKVGLILAKKLYQSEDVKPEKNLTFQITLKPFGSPIAPDLSNFLEK